jgi:hypothetical protein
MFTEFYGLIDGYGLMFDPLIVAMTETIPEYANGFPTELQSDSIIICGSPKTAYPAKGLESHSGIFVKSGNNLSEKERLQLGSYETFYPVDLNYTTFPDSNLTRWTLADQPVVQQNGKAVMLGIELFGLLEKFRSDQPETRSLLIAEKLFELLTMTLFDDNQTNCHSAINEDFRLDCHAYGINRFLINWLGELFSQPPLFDESDYYFRQAIANALNGQLDVAENKLAHAFKSLAKIRHNYSRTEIKFIEAPHIGILFEDEGFFEFEWPDFTRMRIEKLLDFTENNSSKVAFEAGGSCWKHFSGRYPQTIERLNKLKLTKKATVTNGTFSLPYALYSPVGIQYWQFEFGLREHKNIFADDHLPVYQCQENSFTPLTPQLLNHFAYESVLHVVQNRGQSPASQSQFFKWRGADGSTISSMGIPEESLGRKGCNYFYDLPLILRDYTHIPVLYYPNFQDIGFVPLSTQIYRSTRYANIWGEFMLPEELPFATESGDAEYFFQPEEYCLAENAFYNNPTCINSLSQMERIFEQYNKLRTLQQLAFYCGLLTDFFAGLNDLVPGMLLQEAHDVTACQGQKVGDFYHNNSILGTPAKKRYLIQKMDEVSSNFEQKTSTILKNILDTENVMNVFNPRPCELPFARVLFPNELQQKHLLKIGRYAYTPASCKPNAITKTKQCSYNQASLEDINNKWTITNNANRLQINYDSKSFQLSVFDRKRGKFELKNIKTASCNEVIQVKIEYQLCENNLPLHYVDLTLLLKPDAPLLEIVVNYATSAKFCFRDKWLDYLGISIESDSLLGKLIHCTPGYRTEAFKHKIVSPYFISSSAGFSLFNDGATYYEKLNEKSLAWMFHNYKESVQCRRMAVYLGNTDPMLMSSCWNSGVIPAIAKLKNHIAIPTQFIAEAFIESDKLLAVSTADTDISKLSNIEIPGHKNKPDKITAGTLAIFNIQERK